ncbi:hypothetical protein [Dyadobacter sp. CY347]|uniref:hypothetical protein n=1 Tax=Dyadobacter sp. CY347 TaxID=2909336 RepID=UPI001F16D232|nr:hypothetical protein [Dyadobacter sp. CY347]MCF2489290.1 hypothetical protein [Dyadobacter sp. CY347]
MKINNKVKAVALAGATILSSYVSAADQPGAKAPKQGIWRGEFIISETHIPFNFEYNAKNQNDPILTLLNGTRRDDFHVTKLSGDSIFVKMNTYDAALVAKVESDGKITGE